LFVAVELVSVSARKIRPASRSLDIGTRLLDEAVEWTRSSGTHLVLDTIAEMTFSAHKQVLVVGARNRCPRD
jgi:hypothetical protein